jgi:uncharacterized protein (TIGR03663 family)
MATTINQENSSDRNALNSFFARTYILNWEVIAYVIIFLLAMFTRFYALGDRVMSHDESLHTVYSHNLYKDGYFSHSPLMHGPILFHMTALSYFLFGVSDFTARIYTAVIGVMVVMYPLLLRRWLGRSGAILAAIMLLISPLIMYYSRYIRHDLPSILAAMVMFWAIMMYLNGPSHQRRRAHWLYILAAAMIWNLGSKETAFIYIAIFGLFLTLYWIVRVIQNFRNIDGQMVFYTIIVGILLAGVAALSLIVMMAISLDHFADMGARLNFLGEQFGNIFNGNSVSVDFWTFVSWVGLSFMLLAAMTLAPALWAYRQGRVHFIIPDISMAIIVVLTVIGIYVKFSSVTTTSPTGEELSVSTAAVGFAIGVIVATLLSLIYATARIEGGRSFGRQFLLLMAIAIIVSIVFVIAEEFSKSSGGDEEAFRWWPLVLLWLIAIVLVSLITYTKQRGLWAFFDNYPEFDVLMIMGSLVLPWLTAVFIFLSHAASVDHIAIGESWIDLQNIVPVEGAQQVGEFVLGMLAWIPMMSIAVAAGLAWNWRRWLVSAAIFHLLFAFFFTTIFTNIDGFASGMIGSLQYWLEQQGERRGSQPQYYFTLVVMPIYEFLPIVGSVLAMSAGLGIFWRKQRNLDEDVILAAALSSGIDDTIANSNENDGSKEISDGLNLHIANSAKVDDPLTMSSWRLTKVPFLLFVSWWAVFNLLFYTFAGEKMPWLVTHMTAPLIMLSGWYFGRIFDRLDKATFLNKGWILLLLLPFFFIAIAQFILPFLGDEVPFSGTQQIQQGWTYNWLAALFIAIAVSYGVYRVVTNTGWLHLRQMVGIVIFSLLGVFTFRAAWAAAFINYDDPTEFLVYAHGGPGNKEVTDLLRDISIRTTGGMDAKILYDNKFSWPGSWYMRDFNNQVFIGENAPTLQQLDDAIALIVGDENRPKAEPLVEDRFQRFDQMRLWWPMQDYFGLNASRFNTLFDLSDSSAAARRRGMFDIWWSRDYTRYGEAVGKSFELTQWPVSDGMTLFLRRDIAAQVWSYGVGGGTVENPFTVIEENLCVTNWDPRPASLVFDTAQHTLLRPLGITVGSDGLIYVAEEGNHQVSVFTPDGQYLTSFGQRGLAAQEGAFFERPHSVALNAEGEIVVVDTWNYRIRRFTPEFNSISSWGQALTGGLAAESMPTDGFWGPRDIAIDSLGQIYVSDTGNKRIRVYTPDGIYRYDIGSGGSGIGELDEPAGIAIHPDGRLFVADTWNRRVAVFALDGSHLYNFNVRGWYDQLGNRPYLAVDTVRDLLYVTDPDVGRVLIYNTTGECLASFGQFNQEMPDSGQFATVGGIAVDDLGYVYVTDFADGRILRFDPYEPPEPVTADDVEVTPEVSDEANPEAETTEIPARG